MTSSTLAGERRWASSRRGGMTVLGKVAVPKPLNLPSQKLENHGLDPNVEIVPKGSLSWGSRPSSSTSNPWGSSAASPNADGSTVSPHHPSGHPSSGGGLSRPSTAGSDRMHEPSSSTWGSNSRPSSASGVLTSNQSSSRPLSAETRPGSSHLSRFADPGFDNSMAWGPNGTSDKLSPSKVNDFSLSSGDFPTLGSEKDHTAKSSKIHDHGPHVCPGSASGRTAPAEERNEIAQADAKSGTVETWTRDDLPHVTDGVQPSIEKWQIEPQQYVNPNVPVPPQHFDAWRGPPMNAPPAGVWYRGPPAGPPYPPVPHGGYPMEPFPYYRPQPGPPPGSGPRGHHPRNGDFYRPQMPDAFIRPGMPIRPGIYPGPVPYDGYFGPPMGYNLTDRDIPFMGMPPGPPVYNMCPAQNPSELSDPHFRAGGRMFVSEQDSVPPDKSRGPYKVLRKHENERDTDMEEESWEQTTSANSMVLERVDQPRPSFHKNESWGKKSESVAPSFPEVHQDLSDNVKDLSLIQRIEGLNVKPRASSMEEHKNRLLANPKDNLTVSFGSISNSEINAIRGDNTSKSTTASASLISRQVHHGVRSRADHHSKGRSSNQDSDGWRKKSPNLGLEVASTFQVPDDHISAESSDNPETKNTGEVDPSDGQAQRARMRELAQRAIQLQKEEEERIREQKAKALAKLEELNRRTTLAADVTTQTAEKTVTNVIEQEDVDGFQKPPGPSNILSRDSNLDTSKNSQQEDRPLLSKLCEAESKTTQLGNDGNLHRQKRVSHRQKQSAQMVESSTDETLKGPAGAVVKNPGSNMVVSGEALPSQEYNSNISPELTHQRKRNNKSFKNKQKVDDTSLPGTVSLSKESDLEKSSIESGKPESSQFDLDSKEVMQSNLEQISFLPSEESHGKATNHYKPQNSRRITRNPQANRSGDRFHAGEAVVWAPVRAQNKLERGDERTLQDDVPLPEKSVNSVQTNLKSRRAEMERYVPKPVAKELAQHGSITDKEELGSQPAIPVSVSGDNKQNKQVKSQGAWRQRGPTEPHREQGFQQGANPLTLNPKKNAHISVSQHDGSNPVSTETNVMHEWDPSDGWFMPEYPPTEVPPVAPIVKDEGVTGKGKRPAYKDQTDRPASSKENRSSHWQPKPQYARSEVKRESDEPVTEYKNPREGKPATFRGRSHSPNQGLGNTEEEVRYEQHHASSGFRKYGGGQNNRSGINCERQRQNLHYEYQPIGSNNSRSNLDGSGNAAPRYKDRGSGQSRRGGGNF